MKIKFDKKVVPIQHIQEEPLKKRKWDRWIYIGILIILVFSFLKWLMTPFFFNSAQGILLQQQHDVQFAQDIRILEYKVKEGQQVTLGDTLFLYEKFGGTTTVQNYMQDSIQFVLKQSGDRTSLISLKGQIEKRALFLVDLRKRLNYWKEERERKEKLFFLNVISLNELASVDRSIDDISYQLATVKAEYDVLSREKVALEELMNTTKVLGYQNIDLSHQVASFLAPVTGRVDRLRIPVQQVCYKTDKVTSVIYPDYFVKAYLEMSDLAEFKIGDDVEVVLPYGYKNLEGKVEKMYSVSELKDEIVFENTINEQRHGIVVEIVPATRKGWDKLSVSNIPVKVRKGRINIK